MEISTSWKIQAMVQKRDQLFSKFEASELIAMQYGICVS